MESIEDSPNRWNLKAPRLQVVGEDRFLVRAVFYGPECMTHAEVSHIELHANGYLWLACPWNGLISDPIDVAPIYLQRRARTALNDWVLWSRLVW